MRIGYINVFVSNLQTAIDFYTDILGFKLKMAEHQFGYAAFEGHNVSFALAETDDSSLFGRHTGIGFIVDDIDSGYQTLLAKGVSFEMPPTEQPWGGILALMKDPDGNIFYLDPLLTPTHKN